IGQAGQEADEGLLHHVFAEALVVKSLTGKGEQAAFVAGNELLPRALVAAADILDEQPIALGRHALSIHGRLRFTPTTTAARRRRRSGPGRRTSGPARSSLWSSRRGGHS